MDLEYKITTSAELAGANAAAEALERQIGKAKALKQDYSELDKQLKTIRGSLDEYKSGLDKVPPVLDELSNAGKKATETSEKMAVSHKELHAIFRQLGSQTVPELGHALNAAMLGPVGIAIALGTGISMVRDEVGKLSAALNFGSEVESVSTKVGNFSDIIAQSAVEADNFQRVLNDVASAQNSIKTRTDDAVTALRSQAEAIDRVAKSELEARKADINADEKLSPEAKLIKISELEGNHAEAKRLRDKKLRDDELATRQVELAQLNEQNAKVQTAVASARVASDEGKKLLARLEAQKSQLDVQIKSGEEHAKMLGESGSFAGKAVGAGANIFGNGIPGFSEAIKAAVTPFIQSFLGGDVQQGVNNLKGMKKRADSPGVQTGVSQFANDAAQELASKVEEAKRLTTQIEELKRILNPNNPSGLPAQNTLANTTDSAVAANEAHARKTNTDTQVAGMYQAEFTKDATRVQSDARELESFSNKKSWSPADAQKAVKAAADAQAALAEAGDVIKSLAGMGQNVSKLRAVVEQLRKEVSQAKSAADTHGY